MEKDNEVKGKGNHIDFGARGYDPRLGRWLSLDQHFSKYPNMSSYSFTANNPIVFIDIDGKDYEYSVTIQRDKKSGKPIKKVVNVHVSVKVLNLTNAVIPISEFSQANHHGSKIFDYMTESSVYDNEGNAVTIPTTVNVTTTFNPIDHISQAGTGDNVMLVVERVKGESNYAGLATPDGNVSAVESDYINKKGFVQLVLHELGHNIRYDDNYNQATGDLGKGLMGTLNNGNPSNVAGNLDVTQKEKTQTGMSQHSGNGTRTSGDVQQNSRDFAEKNTNAGSSPKLKDKK